MSGTAREAALKEETFHVELLGKQIPVFTVEPDSTEKLPALIVVHEIFAVNEHIKDVARRFAKRSMRVFAPDLFTLSDNFPNDPKERDDLNKMREVWMSIPDTDIISAMEVVFDQVYGRENVVAQKISAIGYCMGGAIAFMFACTEPRLACVVDYYGRIKYGEPGKTKPKSPLDFAPSLKCPMLGIFAGADQLITAEHIAALTQVLEKYHKTFKMKVYENADHAFFNDTRPHYNKAAADDAWGQTLDFIRLSGGKGERSGPT